jgi:hypothetical protein
MSKAGSIRVSAEVENSIRPKRDPRAFQFARMTIPQRQTYAAALSPQDKADVRRAYNWAVANNLIGGGGGPQ